MSTQTDRIVSGTDRMITLFILLGVWQAGVWVFQVPVFILPSPLVVMHTLWSEAGLLLRHGATTGFEILLGLIAGCLLGLLTAIAMVVSPLFRRFSYPLVIVSQTLPVFAIAPLLVIWFGYGLGSKIAMTVLIIYFPISTTLYFGMLGTQSDLIDLARLAGADRWQTLLHFQFPSALPALASGLRVSATMAPIGAIVGEWVGSSAGLGFVMLQANARMQTPVTFAALVVLAALALLVRSGADQLAQRLTRWA